MKREPIQGYNNEHSLDGSECPRCSKCEICLDSMYAQCYGDYAMADICGKCVLTYIDPDETALTACALEYVDNYEAEKSESV